MQEDKILKRIQELTGITSYVEFNKRKKADGITYTLYGIPDDKGEIIPVFLPMTEEELQEKVKEEWSRMA